MATTPYLDLDGLKALSLLPDAAIDEIDSANPGWFSATLVERSAWINARLAKRYDAPFASPYPEIVTGWLAKMVTWRATFKRGYVPTDLSATQLKDDSDAAEKEVLEAANSEVGLYELPLRADTDESGVSKGGPYGYSEQSPYVWYDRQRSVASDEDRNGSGSDV